MIKNILKLILVLLHLLFIPEISAQLNQPQSGNAVEWNYGGSGIEPHPGILFEK